MITKKDLSDIYIWAKYRKFPLKRAPTSEGYCNKDIYISWLKFVGKNVMIRKKLMPENIVNIL